MTWGVLNVAMLAGLLGVALPVVIHLLNRRRDPVVDWGAMQFLELGRWSRRKLNLAELLLMLARMAMLGLVALALARPFWAPRRGRGGGPGPDRGGPRRGTWCSSSTGRPAWAGARRGRPRATGPSPRRGSSSAG